MRRDGFIRGVMPAPVGTAGKGQTEMAHCKLHLAAGGGCARRAGAVILAATLALAGWSGAAAAQQKDKGAPKKGQPAAAQKGAAKDAKGPPSAWVKLCEKATAVNKQKDGKEVKKDVDICLTHHERLDGNTGMVLVSAAVRQVSGQDKQALMVMVPLGMLLQPGMRANIYPKDQWELVQKNEKIDESKIKGLQLAYTLCHPAGCTAETEATPELLNLLKSNAGMLVFAINAGGAPVVFPVPLSGFGTSYGGPPIDTKQYSEARKSLMQQIAQRQQQLIEERKKEEETKAPPAKASGKK
jgi:invasion protein IalB